MRPARLPLLLAALIAFKFALVLVDGAPLVFMGDSGTYLYTALHNYIPHDRGFLYGFLLRPLAIWPHSLRFLVFAQAAMSAVSAWLIAAILTRCFSVRFRWAALLSVLCAIEPLQLLSERYVMTDTTALFLFTVLIAIGVNCCRRATPILVACAIFVSVLLIGIRMSYLPVVMINSVILPLLWFRQSLSSRVFRVSAVVFWLAASQLVFYGYRRLNAALSDMPKPEYLYADGFIMLAEVAPIVSLSDFPKELPGPAILAAVEVPLNVPINREAQIFWPTGLCSTLRKFVPDEYRANAAARRIAVHAILAHPAALVRLTVHTWLEFFNLDGLRRSLAYDEGGLRRGEDSVRIEILQSLGTDLGAQSSAGPVWRWHRAAFPWCWFLVVAPLGIPLILPFTKRTPDTQAAIIYGFLALLFVQAIVASTHSEPRYLMSVAWLTLMSIGTLLRPEKGNPAVYKTNSRGMDR